MKKKVLLVALIAVMVLTLGACKKGEMHTIYDDENEGQETTAVGEYNYDVQDPNDPDMGSSYTLEIYEGGSGHWMHPVGDGTEGTFDDWDITWDEKAVTDPDGNEHPYTIEVNEVSAKILTIDDCEYMQVINSEDYQDEDILMPEDKGDNSVSVTFDKPGAENSFSVVTTESYGYKVTSTGVTSMGIICDEVYVAYDEKNETFALVCTKMEEQDEAEFEAELDAVTFYINNSEEGYKYEDIQTFKEGDDIYNMFFPNGIIMAE